MQEEKETTDGKVDCDHVSGLVDAAVLSAIAPNWPDLSGRASHTIWLPVEDREGAVYEM
jgi:hypothetical protein